MAQAVDGHFVWRQWKGHVRQTFVRFVNLCPGYGCAIEAWLKAKGSSKNSGESVVGLGTTRATVTSSRTRLNSEEAEKRSSPTGEPYLTRPSSTS